MPYATDYVMQSVALRYEAFSSLSLAALAHVTPRTGTRLGNRSFNATDPQIGNKLPASMSLIDNFGHFKRLLSGHLFD